MRKSLKEITEGRIKAGVKISTQESRRLNSPEPKSNRGCCEECGEGFDNEEEWKYNTECAVCGEPIPEDKVIVSLRTMEKEYKLDKVSFGSFLAREHYATQGHINTLKWIRKRINISRSEESLLELTIRNLETQEKRMEEQLIKEGYIKKD